MPYNENKTISLEVRLINLHKPSPKRKAAATVKCTFLVVLMIQLTYNKGLPSGEAAYLLSERR